MDAANRTVLSTSTAQVSREIHSLIPSLYVMYREDQFASFHLVCANELALILEIEAGISAAFMASMVAILKNLIIFDGPNPVYLTAWLNKNRPSCSHFVQGFHIDIE